jgi:hypothetical protein
LNNISGDRETLNNMAANARKLVENNYDMDKVVTLMIKAYEDILIGRRSPEVHWKQ